MKKINFLLFLSMMIVFICGCQNSDTVGGDDLTPKEGTNFSFYTSQKLYQEAEAQRSLEYSNSFEIVDVETIDNQMNITVSYVAGCETNKFDLIWDGVLMESYPYQTRIAVRRTATNCPAEGEIRNEVLSVDLVEFIGDIVTEEPILFHVVNSSKLPDEENADAVVTTTP